MQSFVFFTLIAAASAGVFFEGPCPAAKPKQDFDFASYRGTWYEIARYPNAGEEEDRGKCTVAQYFVYGLNGSVKNSHVINGVRYDIDGDLTYLGPGQIMLTYTFNGLSKNSFLSVMDTDYENYSIGYSCKYFPDGNTHQVFSWIKSRTPYLNEHSKAIVDNYLSQSKILDKKNYVANDFSPEACQTFLFKQITEFLKEE